MTSTVALLVIGDKYTLSIKTPAIKLPRFEGGSDWGVERKLLATTSTKRLVWWTGAKHWQNLSAGYQHRPGELQVQTCDAPGYFRCGNLGQLLDSSTVGPEGTTRLSQLLKHPDAIAWIRANFLDDDALIEALRQNRTITVTTKAAT